MTSTRAIHLTIRILLAGMGPWLAAFGQSPVQENEAKIEFFEKKIRPILVKNCQGCHNGKMKAGGLDLSVGAATVISKEHPDQSRLLRVISYEENLKMPPTGKLKDGDIADLTAWVKLGAPWPGSDQTAVAPPAQTPHFTPEQKSFWAFQPVQKANPPAVKDLRWVHNEIDRFLLAKLEAKGLQPAPPAEKVTLLRRATFDLTGLPPTPQEIQDFLADRSPKAFEKVVDRMLASPRYGERWGRHWLDVARFADSTGNDEDHRYPYAWRYRDYVIDAFNRDVPYDQFVREQIAGDVLLGSGTEEEKRRGNVATGFLALGAKALAQQDKKKMLYDIYDEQVDVTSKAFLGLTMACARCHNHKFDPILSKDYYSLVSIFASTQQFASADDHVSKLLYVPLVPKELYAKYRAQQDKMTGLRLTIDEISGEDGERYIKRQAERLADYMVAARKMNGEKTPADQVASATGLEKDLLVRWAKYVGEGSKAHPQLADWDKSTPDTQTSVAQGYQSRYLAQLEDWTKIMDRWRVQVRKRLEAMDMPPPDKPMFPAAKDLFFYEVSFQRGPFHLNDKERDLILSPEVKEKVAALQKELTDLRTAAMPEPDMACAVAEGRPVDQKVFVRGDYNNPGEDAPKAFPTILARPGDPQIQSRSGRTELASWIASPENPLTARVMVNRIWQWHFGEGLVRTPDNFGKMGDRPSHPELLDYLVNRFIESGWSIKTMHRLIMLSSAYQMASETDEKTLEADPENRLLAHFNRQRLDVEELRDGLLSLDGSLDLTMGGTLQSGFGTDGENSSARLSLDPMKVKRRTVYLPLRRANLPTLLNLFDFGDATTVNGKRTLTNVAPQTLFAMNSEFGFEHARNLAKEALAMNAPDRQRVEAAYLKIINRKPDAGEVDAALTYVSQFAQKYPGESAELNAWQSLCHILMASNEFVYLD